RFWPEFAALVVLLLPAALDREITITSDRAWVLPGLRSAMARLHSVAASVSLTRALCTTRFRTRVGILRSTRSTRRSIPFREAAALRPWSMVRQPARTEPTAVLRGQPPPSLVRLPIRDKVS